MGAETAPLGIYRRYSSKASQCGAQNGTLHRSTYLMENNLPRGGSAVSGHQEAPKTLDKLVQRYALQSAARELLPREGVAKCMRVAIPNEKGERSVSVLYSPSVEAAHFGGLVICKSVWVCPICAAKISERRRVELTEGLKNWSSGEGPAGRRVLLVTFTLSHTRRDDLSVVFDALKRARAKLVSGRGSVELRERFGLVGSIRALELTYGSNGWHPHLHVLMFFGRELPILPFEAYLKGRWQECVAGAGGFANWDNGCDVRFSDEEISTYVTKFGKEPKWTPAHEVTKAVVKLARAGGSTPMQLLSDFLSGDERAGRLWLQYAVNFKGQRQLVWSKGLRELLGLEAEKTDEEIAVEEEEDALLLASLSVGAWRVILANDARAEVLQIASAGDVDRLDTFLMELGIPAGAGRREVRR